MGEEVLEARIEVLEEQIELLQEQLKEANEVINACCSLPETNWIVIDSYREKWGVK